MSENRLIEFLLNQYDVSVILVNKDFEILSSNNFFKKTHGDHLQDGSKIRAIFENQEEFEEWFLKVNKTFESGAEKFISPIKTAKQVKVFEFQTYLIDKDTSSPCLALMLRDIGDNENYERELARQNYQLKKINHELDNFVYSVSHQIRSPLSSLLGLINVAKIDTSDKVNDYLDLMKKSIESLDETVHEINDYSKNARLDVRAEEIDFEATWNRVLLEFGFGKQLSNFKIIKNFECENPFYTDSFRLDIILYNLFSNAIKYNDLEKAEPTIKITIITDEAQAKIVIADNGEGMVEEAIPKIFDMFYRASRSARGAGLGLYIVKEIVQKLKGNINVESTIGEGSRFTIVLPNLKKATN